MGALKLGLPGLQLLLTSRLLVVSLRRSLERKVFKGFNDTHLYIWIGTQVTDQYLPFCKHKYAYDSFISYDELMDVTCSGVAETVCSSSIGGIITSGIDREYYILVRQTNKSYHNCLLTFHLSFLSYFSFHHTWISVFLQYVLRRWWFFERIPSSVLAGNEWSKIVISFLLNILISKQADVVEAYLSQPFASLPPEGYFNASGRAYPDVATYASNYFVYLSPNGIIRESGTSASAPGSWAISIIPTSIISPQM